MISIRDIVASVIRDLQFERTQITTAAHPGHPLDQAYARGRVDAIDGIIQRLRAAAVGVPGTDSRAPRTADVPVEKQAANVPWPARPNGPLLEHHGKVDLTSLWPDGTDMAE